MIKSEHFLQVLMPAIQTNAAIKILDLSKNKITNVGALALAEALRSNQGLNLRAIAINFVIGIKEIVLIDNPRHGDAVIQAMAAMLAEQNITLTKITWRQEVF